MIHLRLLLMQCSESLPCLQNILVEVIIHLSLEMCICAHSLVVDHIGCSICMYQSHIAIFFVVCCVLCTFDGLNWSGFYVFIM